MDFTYKTIYGNFSSIFKGASVDLESVEFVDPWAIGMVCLKAIENMNSPGKRLILPRNQSTRIYLRRMHFERIMGSLTYESYLEELKRIQINEYETPAVQEVLHCPSRDVFAGRLSSRIRAMFKSFGMNDTDEQVATAIVGELGNNVFDHNMGSWPTPVTGAIIIGQRYSKLGRIDVAVADPGVGFLNSLKLVYPKPMNDIDAIKLGLSGVTGRVGEKRGNGLKSIQKWTIGQFSGTLRIHSGTGLIEVDKDGQREKQVDKMLGTLAEFSVQYN